MVFHRYAMSALSPLDEGILFFFFSTTNKSADDGSGQVCGPILRVIPVSCSTARFDDSNPFRGETRAAKKRNTTLHRYTTADWSPTVCIYTRARACAWRSFPFKYLPTKHSSPPLFRGDENCERIAAKERGKGRIKLERNCFQHFPVVFREMVFSC